MKLKRLEIEGFRSLRHVVWEPGDLNILIGPNAGGKSNLLKALDLERAAAAGGLYDYIFHREGGMQSLAWDGTASKLKFQLDFDPVYVPGAGRDPALQYCIVLQRSGESSSYHFLREWLYVGSPPNASNPILDRFGSRPLLYNPVSNLTEFFTSVEVPAEESALSRAAHPIAPSTTARDVAKWLSGWSVYHDFHTDWQSEVRQSVVARSERTLERDGQNLANVLHTLYANDRRFKEDIDDAMNAAFVGQYEELAFAPDADQRIQLKVHWKNLNRPVPAADLSDGTLRFLFLLAILANPSPPPLIAIDEPETGLHPSMLPVIAEFAAEAGTRTQVVFTTHSAEFLDAFRVVSLKPQISVVESHEGATEIKTITEERLDYWLKTFTLGELYRTNGLETML